MTINFVQRSCRALPFAQIGSTGSIYFTIAMTVERYLTVCHPFYHHSHTWPTKLYVLPLLLFSIVYNLPRFFELNVETEIETANSTTSLQPSWNGSDVLGEIPLETTSSDWDMANSTVVYKLAPSKFRLNYYYYTIYLVSPELALFKVSHWKVKIEWWGFLHIWDFPIVNVGTFILNKIKYLFNV